jgi:hypothetical protein
MARWNSPTLDLVWEGGFENTMELKPMKYEEAINGPDGKLGERN